ncbi:MAG: hypothetical protein R6X16_06010 [Anaerolineae bacterium]
MPERRAETFHDERLAIVISAVVLATALSALIALPSREVVLDLFGSELALRFSGPLQVLMLLVLLVCAGVDTLVQHPMVRTDLPSRPTANPATDAWPVAFPYRAAYYALPTTLTIIGLVLVHTVQWWAYQLAASALLGLVLAIVIRMQLGTHALDTRAHRAMRLLLNALAYTLALGMFGLIFGTRLRSLLSATGIMVASGLLALELYHNSETSAWRIWLYAAVTAVLMGELTWALNYTAFSTQLASALLLLALYTLTGLVQQSLWGRLTPRVVGEYVLVLAGGLAAAIILL